METAEKEFTLRVRVGEYEVEVKGSREEVMETIKELPQLMPNLSKALKCLKPAVSAVSVKTIAATVREANAEKYPRLPKVEGCSEALLKVLESDWGKWRPRTLAELKEALEANEICYSGSTLSQELLKLVKEGRVKRWKTDKGYVYILAEKEVIAEGKAHGEG
ncbi:MAG: hypothetical protein N3F10_01855 [Candidatus Bathyarchaeota archaeon]|nr:hypothetical protein [Candidatus Bathyarchaeota archaeon]MCX8177028.1 hypothetical protein [Candidatus Bathyarchaeota archaeon]MDW8194233.1 hypothetical protein [Nitrososphaerota archaeon]